MNVPEREIRFAAKTGFLSKRLWDEFFADGSPSWNRRLWKHFIKRDFFLEHPSDFARDVLVLNRKNPVVMSIVGEEISPAPLAWQFEHDETVARILLGLLRAGIVQSFVTEIELKRVHESERRFGGHAARVKYPDAIVTIGGPSASHRVALEVELSRKSPARYRQCLDTYAARRDVDRVIFIARAGIIFASLKRAMRETYYPDWERPIGFGQLDEWKRNPAAAIIQFSESETSMTALHKKLTA
jgi:hypothetical protein